MSTPELDQAIRMSDEASQHPQDRHQGAMTGRAVPEWIGATPDTPVPPHVKLRVWRAHGGICHISRRKIMGGEPWDADHVKALCNGGENRESNLAPALRDKHREKTADDVAERAVTDTKAKKHLGIKGRKRKIPSRPFGAWTP